MTDRSRAERDARWGVWMREAQQGSAESYERLLAELLPFVRRVVAERVRGPEAEDVVQEALVSIHTARHTHRPDRPVAPWVRAISRNASIDWLRRAVRAGRRSSEVEPDALPDGAPASPAESRALSPGLERALERLPDAQREAVVLLKIEGLSVAEAAERTGITPGALKLRAHRGYRALRAVLGSRTP